MNELDSRGRIHLEWMFENQPELVRELLRQHKLAEHLEAKLQQALRMVDTVKRQGGYSEDEAFEIAVQTILAPADDPAMSENPPEPMPYEEQEAVYRSLEREP